MMRRHSQNLRPAERDEECPTLLAVRLKEAVERHRAKGATTRKAP